MSLLTLLSVLAVISLAIAIPVARKVRHFCVSSTGSRPPLIFGAIAVILGAAVAAPQVNNVAPHMRESPAGLFPILGAAAAVGLAALLGLAILVGVILSYRSTGRDQP
jgi:hypothetical protein